MATTKYSHAFLVGSFNGVLKPSMLDKEGGQIWTCEIIKRSPLDAEKKYEKDKGYDGLCTLFYKSHLDAMLEAQGVKRPKFLNSVHHYVCDLKKTSENVENCITLSLCKGRFPNYTPFDYKFELCRLHLYFFPLDIVLFAIEIDDTGVELDDLTAAHCSLMGYWEANSFDNENLSKLMEPLTKYLDSTNAKKLTKDGNKLKIFQTIKIDTQDIDNKLLYEIGTSIPIGCVSSGNRPDLKPAKSYFEMIIKENSVSTFDNWKGLALMDSFTMLGKKDSFDENDSNFLYFPLIYLRCVFEKTFCFRRNNAYREGNSEKRLSWEIEQMEKYYFYDNISYNFQPNVLYQAMAKGLGIKEERDELTKQIKEKEGKRFDKILAYVAIFAVFSVVWDICSIVMKAIPCMNPSRTAWFFIFIGVFIAGTFVYKIRNKRHEKK